MSLPLPKLIDGMIASLRDNVLPDVSSDYARGQVEAIINLMATLALRVEWSPAIYLRQIAHQQETLRKLRELNPGNAIADALPALAEPPVHASSHVLAERVAEGDRVFVRLLELAGALERTQPELSRQMFAVLDQGMKDVVAEEWRNTADDALAGMSGA